MHKKSFNPLPRWTTSESFDSFHKGLVGTTCSDTNESDIESITESIRYFAEACNRVTSISVMSDMHGGFGGLCSSLLRDIRDDMGNHVMIPLWAMTENSSTTDSLDEDIQLHAQLKNLNIPLCYSNMIEHCNLFIPVSSCSTAKLVRDFGFTHSTSDPDQSNNSHSALSYLAVATAVEAASSAYYMSNSVGVVEWCSSATSAGKWPVAMLESSFYRSNDLNNSHHSPEFSRRILESFNEYSCFESDEKREHFSNSSVSASNSVGGSAKPFNLRNLNPFTTSFSSVINGSFAAKFDKNYVYGKPFVNMLNIRSDESNSDLSRCLFNKGAKSSYFLSNCHQQSHPLIIPYDMTQFVPEPAAIHSIYSSSNNLLKNTNQLVSSAELSVISAVGSNALVGSHLSEVVTRWSQRSSRCSVQLAKIGLDEDDCRELEESLTNILTRYDCSPTGL
mmetsp:Transcript_13296/g.18233  ORF Transcript_13296/g.18233 Transcript_13296/m.18233 type:complete len:448 (+) Transcript_13296:497-1840(+)